jgi:pimeloyl-ACP methyl ester carboxylesterase
MKTEYLHVDGVRSRVVSAGPSDNSEAVVFVHGNPGPLDDYDALFADLGEDVRRIAMDMPGYGDSDRPRDFDYTVEGSAAHLGGLLDQLDVDTTHLVLHDFGGQWGLRWAADHRDRLGSVTLINTGILVDYSWHKFARIW